MISRQAAVDAVEELDIPEDMCVFEILSHIEVALGTLPSAQPKFDEWCDDCKEYDKERHCCPRWNRVIRETVDDMKAAQPGWIPCSERLPEGEEKVIVSIHDDSGDYAIDYSSSGWYVPAGDFWVVENETNSRVIAWMPLPEPWEGDKHD